MAKFQPDTLYTLDVFDYLSIVPDNGIDLAIIDPPYNLNKNKIHMAITARKLIVNTSPRIRTLLLQI